MPLDGARRRLDEPAEHVQQRRLARAGAAEQRDAVARLDLEVDAVERAHRRLALAVDDDDVAAGSDCFARGAGVVTPPAVAHLDDAVDRVGDTRRVRDDDDGAAELVAQPPERVEHDLLVALVELRGRLVGEDERRLARGGSRDRDPLLLAARERAGALRSRAAEAEARRARGRPPARRRGRAREPQPSGDVLARGQRRPEVAALEDDRDLACAVGGELALRRAARASGRRRARRPPTARRGRPPDAAPCSCPTRRAEQRDELARLDPQVEPAQRDGLGRARAEDLEDVVELERAERDLERRSGSR